jgi:hypothetical protein
MVAMAMTLALLWLNESITPFGCVCTYIIYLLSSGSEPTGGKHTLKDFVDLLSSPCVPDKAVKRFVQGSAEMTKHKEE